MSETQSLEDAHYESEFYEIRLKGHVPDRLADWFESMTLTREEGGTTTLKGHLPDQTALHSILLKIRDLNLELLSVRNLKAKSE